MQDGVKKKSYFGRKWTAQCDGIDIRAVSGLGEWKGQTVLVCQGMRQSDEEDQQFNDVPWPGYDADIDWSQVLSWVDSCPM